MIIAGLWRYGNWRHVATGCSALVQSIYTAVAPASHAQITSKYNGRIVVNVSRGKKIKSFVVVRLWP